MVIVVDWHHTDAFGPFTSKDEAGEWLAKQGIYDGQYDGQYEDQEVSILELHPTTDQLKEIKV